MKIIDRIVDMVIDGLENGTVPWRKTWKSMYPMNAFSQRTYKGFNILLLSFVCADRNFSYPLFGTFKQISEAGGCVKRGEKSFPVVYWKVTEKEIKNEETGEEEKEKHFTPFYNNVFNLEQTDDIDIQSYTSELSVNNLNNPLEICESVINNMPNPPRIIHEFPSAFYSPLQIFYS